jgi:SAM-dependent methyltransferase
MLIPDTVRLLIAAIVNLVRNSQLFIQEVWQWGGQGWWWRLRSGLFWEYLTESPFAIVRREGPRAPVALPNLIYGETPCLTLRAILEDAAITAQDHFVDLGCGRGLTVFFAHFYWGIAATGVEIIPGFVRRARRLQQRLQLTQIDFVQENLAWVLPQQISGTIFYLASTTWEDSLLAKIATRLDLLPVGVRVITLSAPLPSTRFQVRQIKEYEFSWGKTTVFFQEKVA